MSKTSKPDDSAPEMGFEDAMERLDEIVSEMEGERMPLDEMVSTYEEGVRLMNLCRGKIESARQRVESIQSSLSGNGPATLTSFEPGPEADASGSVKSSPAKRRSASSDDSSDDGEIRLF